jgi:hypothetical protein
VWHRLMTTGNGQRSTEHGASKKRGKRSSTDLNLKSVHKQNRSRKDGAIKRMKSGDARSQDLMRCMQIVEGLRLTSARQVE